MIKLTLSFDFSLSKVVLGVAGMSASICAFQYFTSKKINLKDSLENNSEISDKISKKDNKVTNLFLTKPSTKDKVRRNESVKDEFKTYKAENDVGVLTNKSKSEVTPIVSNKVVKKIPDRKNGYSSNCEKSDSKSSLNCINSIPKSVSSCEKVILKTNLSCKESISKAVLNCKKSLPKLDLNCEGSNSKCDSNKANTNEENSSQSTNQSQEVSLKACSGSTSESVSHKNKEIQDQMEDKSIEGFDKEVILKDCPSNDDLQNVDKKLKKKMKKLVNNLLQEQGFFDETRRLLVEEKNEFEDNLSELNEGTTAAKLYREICNCNNEVRLKKKNQMCNENIKEFFKAVCDLKEKIWKEAATRLKYSTKLSDEKQKDLKEKFDCVQNMLGKCVELIEIILRRVKCMLEYGVIQDTKTDSFFDDYYNLKDENISIQWDLNYMFYRYYETKFKNDGVGSDFETIENKLNKLTQKFEDICENSYKTLVEDEYQKFADRFEDAD